MSANHDRLGKINEDSDLVDALEKLLLRQENFILKSSQFFELFGTAIDDFDEQLDEIIHVMSPVKYEQIIDSLSYVKTDVRISSNIIKAKFEDIIDCLDEISAVPEKYDLIEIDDITDESDPESETVVEEE